MSFFNQVYELVKLIPKGKVTTYGIIAAALGRPHSAKIVGYALHDNKDPQNVPCYRVVQIRRYRTATVNARPVIR